jgi:hypothetical protein
LTEEEPLTENEARTPVPPAHTRPMVTVSPSPGIFSASTATNHDGSEHLQRMLGIRSGDLTSSASPQTTISPDQSNLLLAMLHGDGKVKPTLDLMGQNIPRTPAVQIDHTPPPPASPKHVHPSHLYPTAHPPPAFPLGASSMQNSSSTDFLAGSSQQTEQTRPINNQAFKPPLSPPISSNTPTLGMRPVAPIPSPELNQHPPYIQNHAISPYHAPPIPSFLAVHSPVISNMPQEPPLKLTDHSLGLLEMLKNGRVPLPPTNVETPKALQNQHNSTTPVIKERMSNLSESESVSRHQSTLLDLFQKGIMPSSVPQRERTESKPGPIPPPQTAAGSMYGNMPTLPSFQNAEGSRHHDMPSSSHEKAESTKSKSELNHFNTTAYTADKAPQTTILARPSSVTPKQNPAKKNIGQASAQAKQPADPSTSRGRSPKAQHKTTKPFQPHILQRPKQASEPSASPSYPPPALDRGGSQAEDQKQVLLSLFGKKSPPPPSSKSATSHSGRDLDQDIGTPESSKPRNGSAKLPLEYLPLQSPALYEISKAANEVKNTPSSITPQDRTFLLGYLQEVARGARR